MRIGTLFALSALAGCALEARPSGTQLAQGRDIDAPHIVWAVDRPLVFFDRVAGDKTDLHALPFDGQGSETVWGQSSTWTTWLSASGFLVAEQGSGLSLFSLEGTTPLRSIAGKVDGLQGDDLLFRQGEGASASFFLQHLPAGRLWELGPLTQRWFTPDGQLYYLEPHGIFRSLRATDSASVTADRLASQFVVAADQERAVVRERPDQSSNLPWQTRDRLLSLPRCPS